MAIQNRRGAYNDFDPTKMLEGEWAVVKSGDPNSERGRSVYMAFENGQVERMATYDDMEYNIDQATTDIQNTLTQNVTQFLSDAQDDVAQMQTDVDDTIANANQTVAGYESTINTALSGINDRMGAIEGDYQDLKDDNAAELLDMHDDVDAQIANTENARLAAVEATANANEAAETVERIIEGGGLVASVFGRSGIVTAETGDYTSAQISHNNGTVADALVFDTTPISMSTKAITSGAVYRQVSDINAEMLVAADPQEVTDPVDFESADTTLNPTAAQSVELLNDGDLWAARFYKISQMFQNIRWLIGQVNNLQIKTQNYVVQQGLMATISSIPANGAVTTKIPYAPPEGYKLLGIVRAFANSGSAMVYNAYYSTTEFALHTKNLTNGAISNIDVYVYAQYIRV